MITVEVDVGGVERRLGEGAVTCPGCGGRLVRWGHARARSVRDLDGLLVVRPRRGRCAGCGVTHVLLPVTLLVRRADTVEVIGAGLAARAAGQGHRPIAARLGRAVCTVRGWLRRFGGRLGAVRGYFTVVAVRVEVDPVAPGPAGSGWADAIAAIAAAWRAVSGRFCVGAVTAWQGVSAVTGGCLLSPSWPPAGPGW